MKRGTVRTPPDLTEQIEAVRAQAEVASGVPVAWSQAALAVVRAGLAALSQASATPHVKPRKK